MDQRNFTLDYLRGVAALMVCACHFCHALPAPFLELAQHGQVGVQVFFVISGYIIPYSLMKGDYRITDIGKFWRKRLVRLQPAYAVALLLTFALSYAATAVKGLPPNVSVMDLVKGFFYLWIPAENPVIWTLIVELKYYVFISIFFPLLFSEHRLVRVTSFCACTVITVFGVGYLDAVRFLPFFLMGFVACYIALLHIPMAESAALLALAIAAALPGSSYLEIAAGLSCCLAILYLPAINLKWGLFLGSISYSLYLIHFPLGVKLLNLALPHTPPSLRILWFPIGIVVCIMGAYVLFRFVEKPSSEWSQRMPMSARQAARRAAKTALLTTARQSTPLP